MMQTMKSLFPAVAVVLGLLTLSSCSKEQPKQEAAPPAEEQQPATTQPTEKPAETATQSTESAQPAVTANAATEKHWILVTNYANTPVTVSLNGQWVGQWDVSSGWIPLESVVKGKNDLTVEVEGEPKNTVTVEVGADRGGTTVNLIKLNYKDKPGKHTASFVAK